MTESVLDTTDIRRISTERMEEIFSCGRAELCPSMIAALLEQTHFAEISSRALRMYIITDAFVQAGAFAMRIGVSRGEFVAALGDADRLEGISDFPAEAERYLTELAVRCVLWRDEMRRRSTGESVKKARDYIEEKLGQEELSLRTVAAAMNFTPAYFSAMFKRETGMNFSAYLTQVRINKAKLLLRDTEKMIYEIANEVGFSDYRYFVSP